MLVEDLTGGVGAYAWASSTRPATVMTRGTKAIVTLRARSFQTKLLLDSSKAHLCCRA